MSYKSFSLLWPKSWAKQISWNKERNSSLLRWSTVYWPGQSIKSSLASHNYMATLWWQWWWQGWWCWDKESRCKAAGETSPDCPRLLSDTFASGVWYLHQRSRVPGFGGSDNRRMVGHLNQHQNTPEGSTSSSGLTTGDTRAVGQQLMGHSAGVSQHSLVATGPLSHCTSLAPHLTF